MKKAEKWLRKFELEDKQNHKIEELSKGMAQKVQFIACMIHEPDLIVFDEPFSGLDPVSQDIFKEKVQSL
ncbi:MAG: ATP-binding cassette domain-containing protein, partial [Thermoplasmatota archaeon]